MWERLRSIWTVPDLRNKILFTLGILLAFRVLANISVPLSQIEYGNLVNLFKPGSNDPTSQVFNLLDVFTGGSLDEILDSRSLGVPLYYSDNCYAIVAADYPGLAEFIDAG